MNIALWILQVLLAAQFLFHGWIMVFPPADLVEIMNAQMAPWFRLFVGIAESLGAIGLLLPGITRHAGPCRDRALRWVLRLVACPCLPVRKSPGITYRHKPGGPEQTRFGIPHKEQPRWR